MPDGPSRTERSPEYPRRGLTRIDRTLQFDMPAGPHLPLFFFNDNTRFNYYQPEQPGRGELPFSIEWSGYVIADVAADETLAMRGRGLEAVLMIDRQPVLRKAETDQVQQVTVSIPAGPSRVTVRVAAPHGRARSFEVTTDAAGHVQSLGAPLVYSREISLDRVKWDRRLRWLTLATDCVLLAVLRGPPSSRCRKPCGRCSLPACVRRWLHRQLARSLRWRCWPRSPMRWRSRRLVDGRLLLLSGGNDMLTYETFARDIATAGPLMLLGAPPGEAFPFYFQPFYP